MVVLYSREEQCRAVHGRTIASATPITERLRGLGLRVIDPNAAFARRCAREPSIYLPDGHWNALGHRFFAGQMRDSLAALGIGP